jgi:FtsP/CotA-like multicopper oxidase with cupredoxin domain
MTRESPAQVPPVPEPSTVTRRRLLLASTAGITSAGALLGSARAADVPGAERPRAASAAATGGSHADQRSLAPGRPGRDYTPVTVPNGSKLPWKVVDGVKVFHMVAEEVEHEIAPGLKVFCWGYNGRVHGPLIEAVEFDRVRIYVTNRLPAPTTVHWHGILLPNGMDGVGGLTQKAIAPGETFMYEFTLHQTGTGMYHSHHDEMTQIALGMTGMFIIHPRRQRRRVDRDFAILLHEWRINPGAKRPDPNEMSEFNVLTMNARAFPGTAPLVARTGQKVRIRLGNLGPMDHHPIHLHGHLFKVTETDGGEIPESAQWPETTALVPVGSTRTIEFVADEPGDWAMHCHMTHHVMNQMGHGVPNLIGVEPGNLDENVRKMLPNYMTMGQTGMGDMGDMGMPVPKNSIPMVGGKGKHDIITMGGMFTILKVRDGIKSFKDPGWYENPLGTLASTASADRMRRDGIDPQKVPPVEDEKA